MKNTKKALNKGFSLIEMLVVIAVIGIIAAIAVPQIGNINEKAKEARAKRNAQNIASIFASAQAAGLDLSGADTVETIELVIEGDTVTDTDSPFVDAYFGSPGVDPAVATVAGGAVDYLELEDGVLKYTSAP